MKGKTTSKTSRAAISPELVEQARAGDQAAFTELYEQTSTGLYRTIRSMARDEDLAWDILQDTYLQAFCGLDKLQANEAFLSWLRRIAVIMTVKKLGQRRPLTFTELAGEEAEGEPEIPDLSVDAQPELALDRKETSRLVREILRALPEEQQLIVGMRYYEDMPIREIAETLHVAPGTVKAQLCFGRKKVEAGVRALERQGVKLYGLSPIPFLMALLGRLEPAAGAEKKVLKAVLAEAPAAAGSSAVTVTALTAGQLLLKKLGVAVAAVTATAVLIVGVKLGYNALKRGDLFPMGVQRPPAVEAVPSEAGLPTALFAPAEAPDNACGPDLTWRLDAAAGTLIIEGSGEMYDYELLGNWKEAPWHNSGEMIHTAVLPEGLTSIGDYAFCGCCGMQRVTIPESVRSIGEGAFRACSLRTLTIPKNVTAIEKDAFYAGGVLESFSVHPENACFSADEAGALYNREQTVLIDVPTGKRGTFAIPDSVKTIGDGAFEHCYELSAVTIPEGLTSIGCYAFTDCIGLTSVTIPDGVTSIGEAAFIYCCQLRSVTIPASVTEIGENAFQYCEDLTIRGVPGSEAERYANENGIPFEAVP